MIYLDNAATTLQKPPQVREAVAYALEHLASPGRGGHPAAMEAADVLYRARSAAAQLFDAEPEQVVFTMNATHGLNIAIKSLIHSGDMVLLSGFEHNAVLRPLYALGAKLRICGRRLFDPEDTVAAFAAFLTPEVKAVVCTHVSNVFGYRLPVEQIAALCRERGVPLIVDASQSAGLLPVSLKEWQAAYVAMPGHKGLYGPQGTGILLCGQVPQPLMEGGTGVLSRQWTMPEELPERAEAGTHNMPGICGLLAGLTYLRQEDGETRRSREERLTRQLCSGLASMDHVRVFTGSPQTNVVSAVLRNLDSETAAQHLAEEGIAVRAGLHCAPLAHESAGTLEGGTVRFSLSAFTTETEIIRTLEVVERLKSFA